MTAPSESQDAWCLRLIATHGQAMRRLVASQEIDPAKRQDLLQDIWLAIWQALPRFRHECSERTFVYRVAHNRAVSHIDRWARRRTEPIDAAARVSAAEPDPERAAETRQRQAHLQAAVHALPWSLRQVVVLSLEGLPHRDIADIVGISEANVAVRLSRAKVQLTRALTGTGRQK